MIRAAALGDELAVARVHVRAWQVAYRGLVAEEQLRGLSAEDRARGYTFDAEDPRTFVAIVDRTVAGFATIAANEVQALYVDPDHWRGGIGAALIARARAELESRGFSEAILWVLVGNERAIAFYRADGWVPDGARASRAIGEVLRLRADLGH